MTNLYEDDYPEGIAADAFDPHVKPKFTGGNALFGFGIVFLGLGRDAILIELNPEYADIAHNRIAKDAGMFAEVA